MKHCEVVKYLLDTELAHIPYCQKKIMKGS